MLYLNILQFSDKLCQGYEHLKNLHSTRQCSTVSLTALASSTTDGLFMQCDNHMPEK